MKHTELKEIIKSIFPFEGEHTGFQISEMARKHSGQIIGYGTLYLALDELVSEGILTRRWIEEHPHRKRLYKRT